MNQQAYIDGYLCKEAFTLRDPVTGATGWGAGSKFGQRFIPGWNIYAGVRDLSDWRKWAQRPGPPKTFEGPHEKYLDNPLVKRYLKGGENEWLLNKYKPKKMGTLERYLPKGVHDIFAERKRERLNDIGGRLQSGGAVTPEERKEFVDAYGSIPEARMKTQKTVYDKVRKDITGAAKKYALPALAIGGGGLLLGMLMSNLFRKQQQGASPQQLAALRAQIKKLQMQGGYNPMRLGLVDKGRGR
jgi:hypothetical protein